MSQITDNPSVSHISDKDALIAELVEALEPFAKMANQFNDHAHDDSWTIHNSDRGGRLELGHLRRARTVINKAKGT